MTLRVVFLALLSVFFVRTNSFSQDLHKRLSAENPTTLAMAAREQGDARRGAVVFYQRHMACAKCHIAGSDQNQLGPDLARLDNKTTDVHLIESLLEPSKQIRKGYEPVTIVTDDGKSITGLLASETKTHIVLRDPAKSGKLVRIPRETIDQRIVGKLSVMPAGQMNALASRQQFLDLIRYLFEIRDGGPDRATELEPPPSLYATLPLPEYESRIDHAAMIQDSSGASVKRGREIYMRVCANCHGTHDRPGSLPTSLRFASGQFKSGNDPYTMYQTITRGFGVMVPQTWMVPQQKYDVIHYIREAYLKEHNTKQYFSVDSAYLAGLPKGDTRGPAPSKTNLWEQMDYGPNQVLTMEIGTDAKNFAYKGNAIRLDQGLGGVSKGNYWMVYDYDTMRVAAAWSGKGFIDWNSIHFNGRHNIHPRLAGGLHFENPTGPGWGNPNDGSFQDTRLVGRDKRIYGPLPRKWAHYKGMYYHGNDTIISYTVGQTDVLELPGLEVHEAGPVFKRTMNVGARDRDLVLQTASLPTSKGVLAQINNSGAVVLGGELLAGVVGDTDSLKWSATADGHLRLTIPQGKNSLKFTVYLANVKEKESSQTDKLLAELVLDKPDRDLTALTHGGPKRWPGILETQAAIGNEDGPFAIDVLTRPAANPWHCRMRLTGFDFFPGGDQMAVSSWDGSVFLVSGIKGTEPDKKLTWQRIASGLFQPLGVKIVEGKIYVTCRDALYVLHDRNGDGEIDFLQNFNNDHQVTDHFHEFAMGLQTDDEGNFYYAKSARHALTALVPHHGTLLKVSKDGSTTEILAQGFRAANGVCLNPDGSFIVTDQEGHWNPKNRINYVKPGGFYGNMFGYHNVTDSSDSAMEQPLCWITNRFDRSPAELLWVDSKAWGPLDGVLLNLSYGNGKVFVVPHEKIDGQAQGGMCALPIPPFPTGVMRGRFHPGDGQLYCCGMFAWAGSRNQPGGLYRVRYTGKPVHVPISLKAKDDRIELKLAGKVDADSAIQPGNYKVKAWDLKRTARYGSKHYNERSLKVSGATLAGDGQTIFLEIPDLAPTWCMEIQYKLKSQNGKEVQGVIHNTIHQLGN